MFKGLALQRKRERENISDYVVAYLVFRVTEAKGQGLIQIGHHLAAGEIAYYVYNWEVSKVAYSNFPPAYYVVECSSKGRYLSLVSPLSPQGQLVFLCEGRGADFPFKICHCGICLSTELPGWDIFDVPMSLVPKQLSLSIQLSNCNMSNSAGDAFTESQEMHETYWR